MKQGLKNLSLFLCLSGILLSFAIGAKAEVQEQTPYQSGTDVSDWLCRQSHHRT